MRSCSLLVAAIFALASYSLAGAAEPTFTVGAAVRDITPPAGLPMWGYAARHDMVATGAIDPLMASAVVIEANGAKLAIVATDLGRGPMPKSLAKIRAEAKRAGIEYVLISGSHTHHGPVIELTEKAGPKFKLAATYGEELTGKLIEAILEADGNRKPAKIGVGTEEVTLNRNRHWKKEPKPVDNGLRVVRFDDESGKPIVVLVNFAAHPVMTEAKDLRWSADFPGAMKAKIKSEMGIPALFLQGAAGDMSPNSPPGVSGPKAFGENLGDRVVKLAGTIKTAKPEDPAIVGKTEIFHFKPRVDLGNPLVIAAFSKAFFPELIAVMAEEFGKGVDAELNTVLINRKLAIVAGSGEFFCQHANRLRARSTFENVLFLGYCNGHHMYFPTIEAAVQRGYGAEPGVSLAEIGAGELMMDHALINLYTLEGTFAAERR